MREIFTLKELLPLVPMEAKGALIVFDVDETLTMPSDPAFQRRNFLKHSPLVRSILEKLTSDELALFPNVVLIDYPTELIEKDAPAILEELKTRGAKMMALTSTMTGQLGSVQIEEERLKELNSFGIDFASSFPSIEELVFTSLKKRFNRFAVYKKGILFTNGDQRRDKRNNSKGETLLAFLEKVGWAPEQVFFIDDREEHIRFAEECFHASCPAIQFIGCLYRGADREDEQHLTAEQLRSRWEAVAAHTKELASALKD